MTWTPTRSVRPATRADAAAIAEVHAASWRTAYDGILPDDYLRTLTVERLTRRWDRILRPPTMDEVVVATLEDQIVGYSQLGPSRDRDLRSFAGEVYTLYVHPDAWGRGTGRLLLRDAVARLSDAGWWWLAIWVLADNTAGRRFYRRAGLTLDRGRRVEVMQDTRRTLMRYVQPLNPVWTGHKPGGQRR